MAKFEIRDTEGSGIAVFVRFAECDKSIFKSVMWDPEEDAWSATWQPRETIMNWLKEAEEQQPPHDDHTIECLQQALLNPQTLSGDGLEILEEIQRVTGLHSLQLDCILEEFYSWEKISESLIAESYPGVPREQLLKTIKTVRRPLLVQSVQKISAYADIEFDLMPGHGRESALVN